MLLNSQPMLGWWSHCVSGLSLNKFTAGWLSSDWSLVTMVWAKREEDAGVAASRSDTELVEASSRQSRRWVSLGGAAGPSTDTWLVNMQGDVRDQQDGGEGGHQVKVDVPQVAAKVTVQVSRQDLLRGLQGRGSINHSVLAKRKFKMIVYPISNDNIIRCGVCLSRP